MYPPPTIIFEKFLRELQQRGFLVSLHDSFEFTAVWEKFGSDVAGFKYYLAPIVCRNKEEQELFYQLYDRHYLNPEPPVRRVRVLPPAPSGGNFWSAERFFRYALLYVFFILAGSVAVKIAIMQFRHHGPDPGVVTAMPDSVKLQPREPGSRGPVFVAKALKPHADSNEVKSQVIAAGQPIEKENSVHSTAFAWMVMLGLACLGVSTSFFPQRRSKFLPEVDLDTRRGDDAPVDLPFRPKDHLIQKQPALSRLSVSLSHPVPTGTYQLDIKKTIRTCVDNYGMVMPVFVDIERRPEYLVLIDRKNELFSRLFRWLVRSLIDDAVHISYYFFDDVSAFYAEGSQRPLSFDELRERHYPGKLIIISDGHAFIHRYGGLNGEVEAELSQWGEKLLLTPFAVSDWGSTEDCLSEQMRVVSADLGNCIHLASYLRAEAEEGGAPLPMQVDTYRSRYLKLEDMDELREYLGDEDLFQWVCAMAVYPAIKWEVILAVGQAVLTAGQVPHKLNYSNLLKIVRIGWLQGRTIPQDIRIRLLKRLHIHSEIVAREKIVELLKESDELIAGDSNDYKEKMLLLYTQSFVLYASDRAKNRRYEQDAKKFLSIWDKQALPDLATVIYLKNQDREWDTPVRSIDNPSRSVAPNKLLNELLAMRVISDPKIRSYCRNAGVGCFALLCLLYLFKDSMQGWGINKTLGLIDRDYMSHRIVIHIPVTDCLKKTVGDGKLTVTLNNFDNNRYSQVLPLAGNSSVRVVFDEITMAGKEPDKESFELILNNSLTIPCTYKEFYPQYDVRLEETDCSDHLRPMVPHQDIPVHPDALTQ